MPRRKIPFLKERTAAVDEIHRLHDDVLEEMRSRNRVLVEVVEAHHESLTQRIEDMREERAERFAAIESAIRSLAEQTRRRDEGLAAAIQQLDDRSRARDEGLAAQIREMIDGSRQWMKALPARSRPCPGSRTG